MSQALRSGAKASLLGALGIITGNAVYFAISALGLGAILIASEVVFYLIKWTGAKPRQNVERLICRAGIRLPSVCSRRRPHDG